MKLFSANILCSAVLLLSSTSAFSFDLSKRALKFDASCNTKYGSLTAKQLIDKSIKLTPKVAKAGSDGLTSIIGMLEYQSQEPGAKKPSSSKTELDKLIATYRVLFGDIRAKSDNGTENPSFKRDAAEHIAAISVTRDSLNRMAKTANPDLIIHCNDDWLSERGPKSAAPKPKEPLKQGAQYYYDMDRRRWVRLRGGKPCQGNRAAVTFVNKKLSGTAREKGPERITFCKQYLKQLTQLEKDKQPHLWDISTSKLPATFTTYTQAGKKDQTLPFHISAFGGKIATKWMHELMLTELFNPNLNAFTDKPLPDTEGGSSGLAYGFNGAVGLAKQKGGKNIAQTSRNIETVLYWSLAMYYENWVWSTGTPEDPSTLTTPAEESAGNARRALGARGGKKPSKPDPKTDKPADAPKTDAPPANTEAPKTEAPPPKTEAPKTEAPKTEAPKTEAPPPKTEAPKTDAPPPPKTEPPKTEAPKTSTSPSKTAPSASSTTHAPTCSSTLCTHTSASPTSSTTAAPIPEETYPPSPPSGGTMTASEIALLGESIAAEQAVALGMWEGVFADMGLPVEMPMPMPGGGGNASASAGVGDATASAGTGLPPLATGGAGAGGNGTWSMPRLRGRGRGGERGGERRMYDFAS